MDSILDGFIYAISPLSTWKAVGKGFSAIVRGVEGDEIVKRFPYQVFGFLFFDFDISISNYRICMFFVFFLIYASFHANKFKWKLKILPNKKYCIRCHVVKIDMNRLSKLVDNCLEIWKKFYTRIIEIWNSDEKIDVNQNQNRYESITKFRRFLQFVRNFCVDWPNIYIDIDN